MAESGTTDPSSVRFMTENQTELLRPTKQELARIASLRGGDLRSVPFATLLLALAKARRNCVVEVRRRHLRKRILVENGVPLECRSNVLHDTFAYYLREAGHLSGAHYTSCTKEALKRGVPVGEVLIERELLTSSQILSLLQKLLAKVLLDVFAWADGNFLILDQKPDVKTPLRMRVEQLVLTGVTRYTPQPRIDQAVATLAAHPLAARPDFSVDGGLRLGPLERSIVQALQREPLSFRDLSTLLPVEASDTARAVYALALLGVVDREERIQAAAATPPTEPVDEPSTAELQELLDDEEMSRLYLDHRRMDAYQLLGIDESADEAAIEGAYLARCRAIGDRAFAEGGKKPEQARELLLAMAQAYAELRDPQRADALREHREESRRVTPIVPELLDPAEHYTQGIELMESGDYVDALSNLEIASDCDPQRGLYRAQAAYCLFLKTPESSERALEILVDTHRIDPSCGLAFLYAGEVLTQLERYSEAEESLRKASKLMAPDRRPIEKLRELRQRERARVATDATPSGQSS